MPCLPRSLARSQNLRQAVFPWDLRSHLLASTFDQCMYAKSFDASLLDPSIAAQKLVIYLSLLNCHHYCQLLLQFVGRTLHNLLSFV